MLNGEIRDQEVKLKQRLALYLETGQFARAASMEQSLTRVGLIENEDVGYALAYAFFKIGDFESAEKRLQELTRPDLFRKSAELRSAMQDCAEEPWQCL